MSGNGHVGNLIKEEEKAVKLFLFMFYIIYFGYELFYYYIVPSLDNEPVGLPKSTLGYWIYILIIAILPIALYLLKKGKPYKIKYIYTTSFIILEIINYLVVSTQDPENLHDGNLVELFIILFAPIFINKKYFWFTCSILIGKYVLQSIFLQSIEFIFPVVVILVVGILAYIFLVRFTSYIQTLTEVFEKQRQNEKLAILGQMATSIGHEIRNPLSALKGFTQLQQEKDTSENSFYPVMIQEIDRINTIVDDLMVLGKPQSAKFSQHDIKKIIEYVTSVTSQLAESFGSKINVVYEENLPFVECNDKQMKQAFINIIKNAIESMPVGGTVKVTLASIGNDKIQVDVEDNGSGIDKDKLNRLGEPFFTTKQKGTGLGLLITKKIIEDHHGKLIFNSKKEQGTKVSVIIPVKQNK